MHVIKYRLHHKVEAWRILSAGTTRYYSIRFRKNEIGEFSVGKVRMGYFISPIRVFYIDEAWDSTL
jgi:hypothetical protein